MNNISRFNRLMERLGSPHRAYAGGVMIDDILDLLELLVEKIEAMQLKVEKK